jgi:hypothetical protein
MFEETTFRISHPPQTLLIHFCLFIRNPSQSVFTNSVVTFSAKTNTIKRTLQKFWIKILVCLCIT